MPRDWDLVRAILLALEQLQDPNGTLAPTEVPNYDAGLVAYHFLLLGQAGMIEALNTSSSSGRSAVAQRLTWAGHELLDAIRSQTIWQQIKKRAREKGVDLTLDVIIALAKQVVQSILQ